MILSNVFDNTQGNQNGSQYEFWYRTARTPDLIDFPEYTNAGRITIELDLL